MSRLCAAFVPPLKEGGTKALDTWWKFGLMAMELGRRQSTVDRLTGERNKKQLNAQDQDLVTRGYKAQATAMMVTVKMRASEQTISAMPSKRRATRRLDW
ncbi:MAG TPA: hypothetical protein VJ499_14760 [Flavisolibacter sp.]|nr:hypothetical protein [Flavisolibacter sp.]